MTDISPKTFVNTKWEKTNKDFNVYWKYMPKVIVNTLANVRPNTKARVFVPAQYLHNKRKIKSIDCADVIVDGKVIGKAFLDPTIKYTKQWWMYGPTRDSEKQNLQECIRWCESMLKTFGFW